MSFFLGPDSGRWSPGTWSELIDALGNGTLNESSWVELKADLPRIPKANVETAQDLASLALRSGLLVLGVPEVSRGVPGTPVPIDLAAVRDRIDQVARNVPSPPIYVHAREIEHPDQPGFGVLLVGVPASGPHMVDGRYWRRGDTGKAVMEHAEVVEHLARRGVTEQDVLEQVRRLAAATPWRETGDQPRAPRLFLRAVPLHSQRGALRPLLDNRFGGPQHVKDVLVPIVKGRPGPDHGTVLEDAYTWTPYAQGQRLTSLEQGGAGSAFSETTLQIEDGGAVDFIRTPMGANESRQWTAGTGTGYPTVYTDLAMQAAHDVLALAAHLSQEYSGYPGQWSIAVRLEAVAGRHDVRLVRHGVGHHPPAYDGLDPDYEATITVTTTQLLDEPWKVAEELFERLVRALGAASVYLPFAHESPGAAWQQT